MKIAIIGTRGIPNNYGGFEQFAEYLSAYLVSCGHEVVVYNPHHHIYKDTTWNGVKIIHQFDPEPVIGTIGQFIYDFNCIWNTRKTNFDIILQLGYTSSSVWSSFFPKKPILVTNMDGLEWKRTKYKKFVQTFLKFAERLAATKSDVLVADSLGIKQYISQVYQRDSHYIPYGAEPFINPDPSKLHAYGLQPYHFDLVIARMEPENNIEMILEGFQAAGCNRPLVVVGNCANRFGKKMVQRYAREPQIRFLGGIYNIEVLNNFRFYSNLYFHGHSVGGTNPSLLEAMAAQALICAHANLFNQAILQDNAYYFQSASDVKQLVASLKKTKEQSNKVDANSKKIACELNWKIVNDQYLDLFLRLVNERVK